MRFRISSLFFITAILLATLPALQAQDESSSQTQSPAPSAAESQPAVPLQWGAFAIQGSASAGYRFTTIKGYQPMYQELFNLEQGPRVMDFSIFGRSDGTNPFADDFSLTTSGLGGDPYPSAQFTVSKHNVYDLRVNWRQSYFYWNQNDDIKLPTRIPSTPSFGLTDNHDWATVRKVGSVDLTLHATSNLRINFNYYRTTFSGDTFTTFSPDFVGSPGSWGTLARADAFYLFAPTDNNTNRFTGGFDYTWRAWNFHYAIGYQTYTENTIFNNVTSPERAIDTTTAATATTPLLHASWTDYRKLTTPVSEFSYSSKPYDWLHMRGSYLFYRYRGPATFDQNFIVDNPTPNTISQTGREMVSEPNNIVEQGFTFDVKPWWDIDVDYRYTRFTTSTTGAFGSLFNSTTATIAAADNQWRDGMHQLDFSMMFTPKSNLIIRPGISLFKSDVESLADGMADPALSLRSKNVSPILSVYYQPTKRFSVRGEIHTYNTGASYTALTPHTDLTGRVVGTFRFNNKWSLDDEFYSDSQQLLVTDFHSHIRSNSTTLNYAMNDKYSFFGGFAYDSELASGFIAYQRGVPVAGTRFPLRDQDINRVIQGGFDAKPSKYFGLRFAGNFDRSTGRGEEGGVKPVYGPLSFPYATGTLYFDFPRAGRLSVDLQRTYYIQQILTANNFSANMLTLRWTRNF